MSKGEPFLRCTRNRPCPVCHKPDWCTVSGDGEVCICARVSSDDRRGEAGWLHKLYRRKERVVATKPKPNIDWLKVAQKYQKAITPEYKAWLAKFLKLPPDGLDCFPLLGYGGEEGDRFFTFPEVNGEGKVIGICRRFKTGKYQLPDGSRGLSVPHDFDPKTAKTVFVVEGPTDVAAMWSAGLDAIGRPSNTSGGNDAACLLQHCPDECRIVVVGENDRKDNHDWPGLHGAALVADQIASILQRRPGCQKHPVTWALCPDGAKDVREWLTENNSDWGDTDWNLRGQLLSKALLRVAVPAEDVSKSVRKLLAHNTELERRMEAVERQMRELLARKS